EVRAIGKKLGLSDDLVMRHPFPGPGLSINVLCSEGVQSEKDLEELPKAQKEIQEMNITEFCEHCMADMVRSVLPVRSVGVQGDFRTYRFPAVLAFKQDENGFCHVPKMWDKVEACSSNITNSSTYLNRTLIKLWQKPGVKDEDLKLQKGYCTKDRLDQLREADNIVLTNLHESGWYDKIFQHLTITLPYATSADRTSFVLRPVCSEDVMTARFAQLPLDLLDKIVHEIAALPFVDALYFDATNKPPATFGWE
ncbi:MAG: glutamine-hydrolyzing GMP synthase, partial [Treponema sp.]|nr:glutamine-hydrolyzing GMP synthase [Treponema sp.]